LMKQDEVNEQLGDSATVSACEGGSCVGALVKQLQANFGARSDISVEGGQLYIKFELYGTLKGQSEPQTIDQFNEKVKDFYEMIDIIKKKVPAIFEKIKKSPQENCIAEKKMWVNNTCITSEQMKLDACEAEGKIWAEDGCKSQSQRVCEATKGKEWHGEECKTKEQADCEKKGNVWENGVCKLKAQAACENSGNLWMNGACKAPTVTPAPVAPAAKVPSTPAPVAPSSYQARVVTEPAGASVSMNGTEECLTTPCNISSYQSNVRLSAALSDYETADTTVAITRPNQIITIKLKPKGYYVSFAGEPSGASLTLTLEGEQYPQTCTTPCYRSFKKGRVKVSASSDAYYERKDTSIFVTGVSSQRIDLKLNPNFGILNIKGADGWNLKIGDKLTPINNIRLLPGAYNAKLTHSDYEDIPFSVEMKKGEHKVFDISDKKLDKYGYLDIDPVYSEDIGRGDSWYLTVGNEAFSLGYSNHIKLLHGEHQIRLTHRCYEDITAEAEIGRNENTYFDMSDKLALKQGTLILRSKRKVRNLTKPVFVNGKQVGETPFEGSVPLCSEIKIGKEGKQEGVYVNLEQNKPVEYIQRETTTGSHVLGAVLDAAGAGLIGLSFYYFNQRDKAYDSYADMKPPPLDDGQKPSEYRSMYDSKWEEVGKNRSKGNMFLIAGGAVLAVGIGVHIWF